MSDYLRAVVVGSALALVNGCLMLIGYPKGFVIRDRLQLVLARASPTLIWLMVAGAYPVWASKISEGLAVALLMAGLVVSVALGVLLGNLIPGARTAMRNLRAAQAAERDAADTRTVRRMGRGWFK